MAGDPRDSFTEAEREEWNAIVAGAREDLIPKISSAAMVMMPYDGSGDLNIYPVLQFGLAILMDKPLLVVVPPGTELPARVRAAADAVVFADLDTEAGQAHLQEALAMFAAERGIA